MAKGFGLRQDVARLIALCGGKVSLRAPSETRRPVRKVLLIPTVTALISLPIPRVMAAEAQERGLTDLSIQELMNIEVTSVSKKAQKLSEAPAAIFVITNEDIRRSGARNVPEALRLAPGVDVAAIGGGRYAVSIRGFTGRFSNKLLVLIDGRSIYTPIFSGVVWEAQGPVLEDIERIEIIRGPGAAIWGANAVNGVINIITKHATDTQGILASTGTGTEDRDFATLRYGNHVSANTSYRIYGKTEARGESDDAAGNPGNDGSHSSRAGFRVDNEQDDGHLSVQGEAFNFAAGDRIFFPHFTSPYDSTLRDSQQRNSGGDLLGRWDKTLSATQDVSLQTYFDFSTFAIENFSAFQVKVVDFEFEHRIRAGDRNDVTWGLSYRSMGYRADGTETNSFDPTSRDLRVAGGFAQDEIRLTPEALRLTFGVKAEHDTYSGTQFMPDMSLLWNVDATNQIWTAVSRAVRTPSVAERDATYSTNGVTPPSSSSPLPVAFVAVPTGFGTERLIAFEIGYRSEIADNLSLDLTSFVHHYRGLSAYEVTGTPGPASSGGVPYIKVPFTIYNGLSGEEIGIEAAGNWRVNDWWRLQVSYSRMRIKFGDEVGDGSIGASPRGILSLRSSMDLVAGTHFDLWLRHVGDRRTQTALGSTDVPQYTTLDSTLSWKLPYQLELSLVGKDLLDSRHPEFISNIGVSSEPLTVERSAYIKLTWTY